MVCRPAASCSVKLTVLGDTTGALDIARIVAGDQLRIDGTASGPITVGPVAAGTNPPGSIAYEIELGTLTDTLTINGDVTGDVKFESFGSTGTSATA